MSAKEQLREEIINKAVVHGKVILSSGKEADYYVDLRRVTLDHVAAPLIGGLVLDLTASYPAAFATGIVTLVFALGFALLFLGMGLLGLIYK